MLWFTSHTPAKAGSVRRALSAVVELARGRRRRRRLRRALSAAAGTAVALVLDAAAAWAQATGYSPDAGAGPGGPQLQTLVNWVAGMILIACTLFIGMHAASWGWGKKRHNMAMVEDGKEGMARGAAVAGAVAAAAGIVKFASGLGAQIQ